MKMSERETKYVFIYSLDCPTTGVPKYIGKTNNLKRRFQQHNYDKTKSKKTSWIKSLKRSGSEPIMTIIDKVEEYEDNFWEIHYISLYKSWGFQLKNGTNGGDGFMGEGKRYLSTLKVTRAYQELLKIKQTVTSKEISELSGVYVGIVRQILSENEIVLKKTSKEVLEQVCRDLYEEGMKITFTNLKKKSGYSNDTVNKFLKTIK